MSAICPINLPSIRKTPELITRGFAFLKVVAWIRIPYRPCRRLNRHAHDLGWIDDAAKIQTWDHVAVFFGLGVEAVVAGFFQQLADND